MDEPQEIRVFRNHDSAECLGEAELRLFLRRCHGAAARGRRRPSVDDLEDLVQESLLVLWRRQLARGEPCAKAYAGMVAASVYVDSLRHASAKKRGAGRTVDLAAAAEVRDAAAGPAEKLLEAEQLEGLLARVREAVSPRVFAVLWFCWVEGHTATEVSQQTGLSPSGVHTLLHRARRALRPVLAEWRSRADVQ